MLTYPGLLFCTHVIPQAILHEQIYAVIMSDIYYVDTSEIWTVPSTAIEKVFATDHNQLPRCLADRDQCYMQMSSNYSFLIALTAITLGIVYWWLDRSWKSANAKFEQARDRQRRAQERKHKRELDELTERQLAEKTSLQRELRKQFEADLLEQRELARRATQYWYHQYADLQQYCRRMEEQEDIRQTRRWKSGMCAPFPYPHVPRQESVLAHYIRHK